MLDSLKPYFEIMGKLWDTCAAIGTWSIRLVFLWIFTSWTLVPYTLALITDMPCFRPRTVAATRRRQWWMSYISAACWKIALCMCFWIRRDCTELAPLQRAGLNGKGVYMCVNHVSFFDTPLVCSILPWRLVPEVKAVMVRWLLKVPVVGRIANVVGHLPLPFVSGKGTTNYRMDESLLESYMQRIEDHVSAGGSLALFPEGIINPNWTKLLQFRGGGFEIAIRHEMEVWGLVTAGVADTWPSHVAFGGSPAKINLKAIPIATNARELAVKLAGEGSTLKEQGIALANLSHDMMQTSLDELCAARVAI